MATFLFDLEYIPTYPLTQKQKLIEIIDSDI